MPADYKLYSAKQKSSNFTNQHQPEAKNNL
jgi:hypothetical protein